MKISQDSKRLLKDFKKLQEGKTLQLKSNNGEPLPKQSNSQEKQELEKYLRENNLPHVPRLSELILRSLQIIQANRKLEEKDLPLVLSYLLNEPEDSAIQYGFWRARFSTDNQIIPFFSCTALTKWLQSDKEIEESFLKHYPYQHFADLSQDSPLQLVSTDNCLFLEDKEKESKLAEWSWQELEEYRSSSWASIEVKLEKDTIYPQELKLYWQKENNLKQIFEKKDLSLRIALKRRKDGKIKGGKPKQVSLRIQENNLEKLFSNQFIYKQR